MWCDYICCLIVHVYVPVCLLSGWLIHSWFVERVWEWWFNWRSKKHNIAQMAEWPISPMFTEPWQTVYKWRISQHASKVLLHQHEMMMILSQFTHKCTYSDFNGGRVLSNTEMFLCCLNGNECLHSLIEVTFRNRVEQHFIVLLIKLSVVQY